MAVTAWRSAAAGRVDSLTDWIDATGRGSYQVMAAPEALPRPPVPDAPAVLENLHRVRHVIAPAAVVARISDGLVTGPEGTVITPDGCLVADLTRAWSRPIEDHPVWTAAAVRARRVEGTAAVIAARGAGANFSHFLADTMPRIQLVRDAGSGVDTWILSDTSARWQREALDLAGIDLRRTVSLAESPVLATDLVVPSRTGFAPATAPWARRALRALLSPGDVPSRRRRIFVTRTHARRRRLANEALVVELLAQHGFEVVCFDSLPVADQIRTLHEARVVVAQHGAALSHLLHAPPGGMILEITDPRIARPEYWGLAGLARWDYYLVPAATAGPHDQKILADHELPLHHLEDGLAKVAD